MECARYSCQILMKLKKNNLPDRFPKNLQIPNFTKIHPVGTELFHAEEQKDRRTDRHDEANSRFSQFCERA